MDFLMKHPKEQSDTGNGLRQDDQVNPLSRKLIKRLVCVDSVFRPHYDTTKSNDFIFYIPEHIKKVVSMKIASIELPNTQFMFSSANYSNTFFISINEEEPLLITIPDGSYIIEEITSTLTNLINDSRVEATYDYQKGRVMFTHTGTEGQIQLDFTTSGAKYRQNAGWYLGFRNLTYEKTISTEDPSIIADSIFGANIDKYIFLDIDDYQRNFLTGAVISVTNRTPTGNSSYIGNTIMAKIPMSTDPNTIMFNNGLDQLFKNREYFGPVKLEKLRIRLLNKYGDLVDFNNEDYSISIEITEMY
jgi:hypothetical protein